MGITFSQNMRMGFNLKELYRIGFSHHYQNQKAFEMGQIKL